MKITVDSAGSRGVSACFGQLAAVARLKLAIAMFAFAVSVVIVGRTELKVSAERMATMSNYVLFSGRSFLA